MLKGDWRKQTRVCHCGANFQPKREAQRYCAALCRDLAAKRRKRSGRSMDKKSLPTALPGSMDRPVSGAPTGSGMASEQNETRGSDSPTMVWRAANSTEGLNPNGSTPGALPGNYPLEYYPDGYPKLPPCLDRRRKPALSDAA